MPRKAKDLVPAHGTTKVPVRLQWGLLFEDALLGFMAFESRIKMRQVAWSPRPLNPGVF